MNMELLMQNVTYALMAVGVAAFLVSCITQVIKDLPWVTKIPTSVVALCVPGGGGDRLPVLQNSDRMVLHFCVIYCSLYCVSGSDWWLGESHGDLAAVKI